MTVRPFHHGNLRAVLLEQAEILLRAGGADGLSLRELARHAGVSHGAPRSHFIDRQALLDALAVRGFERLTEAVRAALASEASIERRFRAVGHAYVDFAVDDAALMELMFAAKVSDPAADVEQAAGRLFATLDAAMADASAGAPGADDRDRFKLLFAATMQGTATLIASRRVSRDQGDAIVDDAVDVLLGSPLAHRAVPRR
ncbi:TetR family transcriptional regulator [Frondihabitans sp. PAMC 28766]|uniref:TetR/AcrR family transcriptional regulator n=1 Tax=Frondihabitans sp. PAMC 28766 TaxID=1795630 RepID=UPI00078D0DC6|nr:TetR/AcrR family transcriptional regulator [Frondihabitans sp. PAMC 28766]AMM19345.1 TetR family transcriptional regulator [Frondihabitans sp. PAMC 28766]